MTGEEQYGNLLITGLVGSADVQVIDDHGRPIAGILLDPDQCIRVGMHLLAIVASAELEIRDGWLDDVDDDPDATITYRIARPIRVHRDVDGTWRIECRDHRGCSLWHFTDHHEASYVAHHHAALRHSKEHAHG